MYKTAPVILFVEGTPLLFAWWKEYISTEINKNYQTSDNIRHLAGSQAKTDKFHCWNENVLLPIFKRKKRKYDGEISNGAAVQLYSQFSGA